MSSGGRAGYRKGLTTEHRTPVSRYEQLMAAGGLQMLATSNVWDVDAAVGHVVWCLVLQTSMVCVGRLLAASRLATAASSILGGIVLLLDTGGEVL